MVHRRGETAHSIPDRTRGQRYTLVRALRPSSSQSIVSASSSMGAPREGQREPGFPKAARPPLRLLRRAGLGRVVLVLGPRLADLDRRAREIRGQVAEAQVQAAIAVLVGGDDPRPVAWLCGRGVSRRITFRGSASEPRYTLVRVGGSVHMARGSSSR